MSDNKEFKEKINDIESFLNEDEVGITKEEEAAVYLAEEQIIEDKEFIKAEEIKAEGKFIRCLKVLLGGVIDQILALGLALVLFFVTDLILRLCGYEIVMRETMYMIMYVISNVLYYPIISEMLHGKTLGKKLLFR